jgi:predicted MPP superfamily phosphohydrolase
MKKYFITSDTHGFFTILKNSLKEKGFDIKNPDHYLIICGDLFDRGPEAVKMLKFVKRLKDRFIYIRGNHEDLFKDCLYQMETGLSVSSHHYSNKTVDTINQFLHNKYGEYYNEIKYEAFKHYIESGYQDRRELDYFFKPLHRIENWIDKKKCRLF